MISEAAPAWQEASGARWARRAITLTVYPVLFALYLGLVLLCLPVLCVIDAARRSRFAAARAFLFFGHYLFCEIVGILAAAALWVAFRVTPGIEGATFTRWNFRLQCIWARALGGGGFRIFGMQTQVDIPAGVGRRPLLLFVRHASTADTILAAMFIADRFDVMLRYVLKRELLWDPCLDIVGNRLCNVFVRRGGEDAESDVAAVSALADDLHPGEGILIYPEGTRFSPAKRRRILKRIARRGDEAALARAASLTRVLPPRLGGPLALLDRASAWDVAVCAHVGLEGATSFADFWNGALIGACVRIRISVFPSETLPGDRQGKTDWLYRRWGEVDAFVIAHAK